MKIHFTKKEYRQLLYLVFLGDWMVTAHDPMDASPYAAVREKLYAQAKAFGFDDLIVYNKSMGIHTETAAFEEQGVMNYVFRYNDEVKQDPD